APPPIRLDRSQLSVWRKAIAGGRLRGLAWFPAIDKVGIVFTGCSSPSHCVLVSFSVHEVSEMRPMHLAVSRRVKADAKPRFHSGGTTCAPFA
ncbi:hypothetical protein, partial [Mycobacterium avium]|uniref:hypothetical protein n=3 Tax=Mycobacteriaceae TaxID=1762 RepID=UPI001E5426AF